MMKLSIRRFVKIGLGAAVLLAVAALLPNSPILTETTELDRQSWRCRHSERLLGVAVSRHVSDTFVSAHVPISSSEADWQVISRRSYGSTLRYKQMANRLLSAMHNAEYLCREHGVESNVVDAICRNARDLGNNHGLHVATEYLRSLESMHDEWTTLSNLFAVATATDLTARIMAKSGLSADEIGSRIENPMPSLPIGTQFEYAIAKSTIARVGKLPALTVSGRLTGVQKVDLVNTNRNLLLVLNPNFISHGNVYGAGPVLLQRGASVFGMVVSADTVFMVQRPTVMAGAIGFPVFFGWAPKPDHPTNWRLAGSGLTYRGEPQETIEAKLRQSWFDPKVMEEQGIIRITEED